MQITRRQFLKYVSAAGASLGLTQVELGKLAEVLAKDASPWRVVWIAGQACTGCTMALSDLNSIPGDPVVDGYDAGGFYAGYDTLDDALLTVIDLDYHETISAASGDLAMDWLRPWSSANEGSGGSLDAAVLIVEGAIPVDGQDAWGRPVVGELACTIGSRPPSAPNPGQEITVKDAVVNIAKKASTAAVVAVGQCACYGGIPAAYSDAAEQWSGTGKDASGSIFCNAKGVQQAVAPDIPGGLNFFGATDSLGNPLPYNKLINVPGCPPHPDWMYGTLARVILGTPPALDVYGRPKPYYGETIHGPGGCPRYQDYNDGYLAKRLGDKGCLASIGCYGMSTHSDCAKRGWNNTRNNLGRKVFCIEAGHPCISCTEQGYPFKINTNG